MWTMPRSVTVTTAAVVVMRDRVSVCVVVTRGTM
jgi:hypothetical protein